MKGFNLIKPFKIQEQEFPETQIAENLSKVRLTKSMITLSDVLRYNGEIDVENVILGSVGIGILSEDGNKDFDLNKGKRVYIEPFKACENCYSCKTGNYDKCSDLKIAGEDFNGFLSDFVNYPTEKLFSLPDSVSDNEALFINQISLAIAVYDKLNVKKGDYVAIVGGNNFANLFAQLLIYYQAVPIVMTYDKNDYNAIRESGVYYVLGEDDNWQKEVSVITSGRMTDKVVYVADCNIPVVKAFSLASFGASVAFTGNSNKSGNVSFMQAVKKQLDIHFINNDFGNTPASINLIANKAINFSHLKVSECAYSQVPETFNKLSKELENTGVIPETIVKMI